MTSQIPTKLGDYIRVKHGFAFKGEYFTDEVRPDILVTPGNFSIGGGFQEDKFKYYEGPVPDEYVLRSGDLVVTMTDLSKAGDTLGYPALIPASKGKRYLHNQRIGLIEIKNDAEADKSYLFYRLRADDYRSHILATASGSTVRHTSPNRISEFETNLPPLDEQRAVAGALSSIENKISQNKLITKALERLAQAMFRAWFVEFEPISAKQASETSFPAMPQTIFASLPSRFIESEIGLIPENWKSEPLSSICSLISGGTPKRSVASYWGCRRPLVFRQRRAKRRRGLGHRNERTNYSGWSEQQCSNASPEGIHDYFCAWNCR